MFARANVRDLTKSALTTADFHVYTTDLFEMPAGPVGFAFGGDWRREQFDFNPDDTDETGDQIGVGQAKTSFGGRKAYGIFAETQIPITSPKMGIPGLYSLEFNASGRFEEFLNNSSNVLVPRIGIRWQPFDEELTIRATWGEGFIEPSLAQLFGAPIFILATTNTQRRSFGGVGSRKRLRSSIPTEICSLRIRGTLVLGLFTHPSGSTIGIASSSLTMSVDFWDVERTGVVTMPSAQVAGERIFPRHAWSAKSRKLISTRLPTRPISSRVDLKTPGDR